MAQLEPIRFVEVYLISPPEAPFLDDLEPILGAGAEMFQYRRCGLSDHQSYDELVTVRTITERTDTKLIVNDRPDLALAVNADGVHLGDDDLPVGAVKTRWSELIVGRTQRAHTSPHEGADYLSVGPVFPSFTKNVDEEPCGWDGVRRILSVTDLPVYAIGGLTPEKLTDAPAEINGVVLVGAVWNSSNPVEVVRSVQ